MKPRSQGGKNHVENLLFLCGAWGDYAGHDRKTAGVLKIDRAWLTDEQVHALTIAGIALSGLGDFKGDGGACGFAAGFRGFFASHIYSRLFLLELEFL